MSQWDYKIDQPMPGPFPFPNLRKGPGIEVGHDYYTNVETFVLFNYKNYTVYLTRHTYCTNDIGVDA